MNFQEIIQLTTTVLDLIFIAELLVGFVIGAWQGFFSNPSKSNVLVILLIMGILFQLSQSLSTTAFPDFLSLIFIKSALAVFGGGIAGILWKWTGEKFLGFH